MNYREKAFKTKFGDAAKHLNVSIEHVISLKLRETVSSYREYHDLLRLLESEAGVKWHEVDANLQGQGYLVGDAKNKAIVVEHETGLEILYVAGSVASLVGLVPLILQCWSRIRGHGGRARQRDFRTVEVRWVDRRGRLVEEQAHGIAAGVSAPLSLVNVALTCAAEVIDREIKALREDVKGLAARVGSLEKKGSKRSKMGKKTVKKSKKA